MEPSARDFEDARTIAASLGFTKIAPRPIGAGVASFAWLLSSQSKRYVLKISRQEAGRPCTYWSEALVMRTLRDSRLAVPEVIAVSPYGVTEKRASLQRPWILLAGADGNSLNGQGQDRIATDDLAAFLFSMHLCTSSGYGPLCQGSSSVVGTEKNVTQGLIARWCSGQFWPYDGTDLPQHPLAAADEKLLREVESLIERDSSDPTDEPNVLLHSDLHAEHVFIDRGKLAAIIDFGGAFIGPRSWEFAPIALFLGWETADAVMQVYGRLSGESGSVIRRKVEATALIFGLYRYDAESRAGRLQSEGPKIIGFLQESAARARSAG